MSQYKVSHEPRPGRPNGSVRPHLPASLATPEEKLVYTHLALETEGRIDDFKRALRMDAIDLYPVLESLIDDGLVDWRGGTYVAATAQ